MTRALQFAIGMLILFAVEISRYDFNQAHLKNRTLAETVQYFVHNAFYFRTIGLLIILFPLIHYYWAGSRRSKMIVSVVLAAYVVLTLVMIFG